MKELIERKGCFLIGILIIVFSNFLPFLAFAQDEVPLFPYDTVQVDGEEKEKSKLVLERKKGTPTVHVISLKGNRDGKLSITKTSEFLIEPLAAETNMTTRQEDGKEIIEIPLSQGKVTSFKLTLTGEGTAQALNATFAPTEKETLTQGPTEPQLALAPFTFQLAEIKTLAETPAETFSSSTTRTTESRKEKAAAPKTAAPEIPTIQRAPVGATITQTGLIGTCKYEFDDAQTLTIYPGEMDPAVKPAGSVDMATFRNDFQDLVVRVKFSTDASGGKIIPPKDSSKLLSDITSKERQSFFAGVREIDFAGNFDTSNVVNMSSMFSGDRALQTIKGLADWDTSKVTNMSSMFTKNEKITIFDDIGGWDTSKVTTMSSMFGGMVSLKEINTLEHWDLSNVTDLYGMFGWCSALVTPGDLSEWNISKVTDLTTMFNNCGNLEKIGYITKWNTSSVRRMYYMFGGARKITTEDIGDLGTWNVANVIDFSGSFNGTASLSVLNFKDWQMGDKTNSTSPGLMLTGSGITKIILGDKINVNIDLPTQKLGHESSNRDTWKFWCGVGEKYYGTENPQKLEGEILNDNQYIGGPDQLKNEADTYLIAEPKLKAIDIAVKDAWDKSAGIENVDFRLYNDRTYSLPKGDVQVTTNVFGDEIVLRTDDFGNFRVENMPAANFYQYFFYQINDSSALWYQKYWPLVDVPGGAFPRVKKINLQNIDATGTIIPKPDNPIYMVPRVSIRINATDEKGKPVAGVKLELHDKNGNVVTKLGSKNFVQPVTGKDGTAMIKDYYIENPEDYSLQLVKPLPVGFDPANGEIFTADTTTPSKTLVHFGGEYNIDVKLKQAEVVLPMTGSDDLGDWGTVLFGAGDLALAGLVFKTIKRKYGLR
ncbi:BspA family leucine-rich repeat surface protein [Enterococcus hirae]|nr:BspA family leucine-rich repeat surface protein [Enterococcus hirae]